jgi:5-hydroxyisourate hydrolase
MMAITTHVLDTSAGKPGSDIAVELSRRAGDGFWELLATANTNADGRVTEWQQLSVIPSGMAPSSMALATVMPAVYRLSFAVAAYFTARGCASFFPEVQVVFEIVDTSRHYHVPLLLSPYGYSTYRGS